MSWGAAGMGSFRFRETHGGLAAGSIAWWLDVVSVCLWFYIYTVYIYIIIYILNTLYIWIYYNPCLFFIWIYIINPSISIVLWTTQVISISFQTFCCEAAPTPRHLCSIWPTTGHETSRNEPRKTALPLVSLLKKGLFLGVRMFIWVLICRFLDVSSLFCPLVISHNSFDEITI